MSGASFVRDVDHLAALERSRIADARFAEIYRRAYDNGDLAACGDLEEAAREALDAAYALYPLYEPDGLTPGQARKSVHDAILDRLQAVLDKYGTPLHNFRARAAEGADYLATTAAET